jgi:hypothetical protein
MHAAAGRKRPDNAEMEIRTSMAAAEPAGLILEPSTSQFFEGPLTIRPCGPENPFLFCVESSASAFGNRDS